ncbi:hypothetical protein N7U66_08980 [Lacinutrix neustonica]|uniref:Uncharacterized protein n=1 Tax=Lacinutrix neustonica TaxID=2980107 RepID=A0A9E8MZY4_9FLAO|nr:hypothetical protein [Lacinutrix neustonica]WAC03582.1 hypothetical protein N7U66_08980 [Lacinutrix neustonica]
MLEKLSVSGRYLGNARFTNQDTEVTSAIFDNDGTQLFGGAYGQLSQVPSDIDVTQFNSRQQ